MKVAVMGAGAVGCYFGGMLARAGHDVSLLDADAERLAFATDKLGFISTIVANEKTVGAVSALTHDEGFDAVFDATGNANSIQSAFAHVAHGGSLVLVSVVKDTISFSDPEFHKREMMLIGSRNATRRWTRTPSARSGPIWAPPLTRARAMTRSPTRCAR